MYKDNLLGRTYSDYTRQITALVLHEFGASYATAEQMHNAWLRYLEYRPDIERFLIDKTNLFITTLPTNVPAYIDPAFLNALTNCMANYLSEYTVRAYAPHPDAITARGQLRRDAKAKLKAALYDNSAYIQGMYKRRGIAQYKKQKNIISADDKTSDVTPRKKRVRINQVNIDDVATTFDATRSVQDMLGRAAELQKKR